MHKTDTGELWSDSRNPNFNDAFIGVHLDSIEDTGRNQNPVVRSSPAYSILLDVSRRRKHLACLFEKWRNVSPESHEFPSSHVTWTPTNLRALSPSSRCTRPASLNNRLRGSMASTEICPSACCKGIDQCAIVRSHGCLAHQERRRGPASFFPSSTMSPLRQNPSCQRCDFDETLV